MIGTQPKTRFSAVNIALISIFSALWIVFNFTVAPLGFQLTKLPLIHAVISFLTLLLATWATGQYGTASAVGMIGSTIVLIAGGPLPVLGFAAASLLFDVILLVNHHRLNLKPINIAVALMATAICGYFAGLLNGFLILNYQASFVLTFWGPWTVAGGIIGFAIAYPIVSALEKANVKQIKAE